MGISASATQDIAGAKGGCVGGCAGDYDGEYDEGDCEGDCEGACDDGESPGGLPLSLQSFPQHQVGVIVLKIVVRKAGGSFNKQVK